MELQASQTSNEGDPGQNANLRIRHFRCREELKDAEGFGDVEIGLRRVSGPPGGIEAGFGWAFDAEEISAPLLKWFDTIRETVHGDSQFCDPQFRVFVDGDAAEQATLQIAFFAGGDVEVDPEAVGADFKFFVAAQVGWIGLKKDFGDVAVPELVTSATGFGVGKNRYCAVSGAKLQKETRGGPQEADLGLALLVGVFSLPVCREY